MTSTKELYNQAIAKLDAEKFNEAIVMFDSLISQNAEDYLSWDKRGLAFEFKNDFQEAILSYNMAIKINPRLPEPYYNKAIAYSYTEDYEKGIGPLKKALKLNPSYEAAIERLVAYYIFLGKKIMQPKR